MADLHDLSVQIGRLQSSEEASQRQRKDLYDKIDSMREDISEIKQMMAPLATMPTHIKSHCAALDQINGYVNRVKGAIWAGRAVWVLLVAICGAGAWLYSDQKAAAKENADRFSVVWSAINRLGPMPK